MSYLLLYKKTYIAIFLISSFLTSKECCMSSLNKIKKPINFTYAGAPAKNINAEQALRRSVMSCLLWENTFYEDGVSIAERISDLCQKVDNEKIASIAVEAKVQMKLRHVPLLLLTELCKKKYNVRKLVPELISRADDITETLAIYWKDGKKPISKSLWRGLRDSFYKFDEYALGKYKGSRKAISLKNAIKILRPKPLNQEQAELWKRLVKDELKIPETWEVLYSKCKTNEEKLAVWQKLTQENKLGGLALLRNLRNMQEVGFDATDAIKKLNARKLLPLNFIKSAEINLKYENVLEEKFLESFVTQEKISGKTIFLFDISGSMEGQNEARQAGLAMIAREMFTDAEMYIFGDKVYSIPARRGFALRDLVKARNEGTQLGQAVKFVNTLPYDRLIVITDEQSSDKVPDPINKGYMINVATNKNGVGYGKWIHIDGWSDKILNYILEYEKAI